MGRTLLSAAFALDVDFDLLDTKPNPNGGGQECPPHTDGRALLNQRASVDWLFFWGDHHRCGYPVSRLDVQEADALG